MEHRLMPKAEGLRRLRCINCSPPTNTGHALSLSWFHQKVRWKPTAQSHVSYLKPLTVSLLRICFIVVITAHKQAGPLQHAQISCARPRSPAARAAGCPRSTLSSEASWQNQLNVGPNQLAAGVRAADLVMVMVDP